MRTLRLARVIAEAEGLRLRRLLRRVVLQVAFGAVGAVFLLFALIVGHVALILALMHSFGPVTSSLIVFGADLVLAVILLLIASASTPGPIEAEARVVRDRARQQLAEALATTALMAPLSRAVGRKNLARMAVASMVARLFATFRRH